MVTGSFIRPTSGARWASRSTSAMNSCGGACGAGCSTRDRGGDSEAASGGGVSECVPWNDSSDSQLSKKSRFSDSDHVHHLRAFEHVARGSVAQENAYATDAAHATPPRRVHLRDGAQLRQVARLLALGALRDDEEVRAVGQQPVLQREGELSSASSSVAIRRAAATRAACRPRPTAGEVRPTPAARSRRPRARARSTPRRRRRSEAGEHVDRLAAEQAGAAAWPHAARRGHAMSARSTRGARSRANMRRMRGLGVLVGRHELAGAAGGFGQPAQHALGRRAADADRRTRAARGARLGDQRIRVPDLAVGDQQHVGRRPSAPAQREDRPQCALPSRCRPGRPSSRARRSAAVADRRARRPPPAPRPRARTVLPKRDKLNRSAGVEPREDRGAARAWRPRCCRRSSSRSSRRASFSRSGSFAPGRGTRRRRSSPARRSPSPSRATVASDVAASPSTVSTKSRSSHAPSARRHRHAVVGRAVAIGCEGEAIRPCGDRRRAARASARTDRRPPDR